MSVSPISGTTPSTITTDEAKAFYAGSLESYTIFQDQWNSIDTADKIFLSTAFQATIGELLQKLKEALEALNAALEALENTIDINEEIQKIKEFIEKLTLFFNGSDVLMSLMDRIDCLKVLAEEKGSIDSAAYGTIYDKLNSGDPKAAFSVNDFSLLLSQGHVSASQEEYTASKNRGSLNVTNLAMKVIQENNQFLTINLENSASDKLQTTAEFNPQLKNLRDEGRWIQQETLEKQKHTEALQEVQRRQDRIQNLEEQQRRDAHEDVRIDE